MNMGIEPFLVSTSVNLICAQRLVRRICKECKEPIQMPTQALVDVGYTAEEAPKIQLFKGRGCQNCNNTGYRGRVGLFEVMDVSDEIRELILSGASAIELRRKGVEEGMITLRASGLHKIRAGSTTVEEVVRETVL
jgi:type IV pilus assembly protein PilB